jgi:hypothetical protein
MPKQRLKQQDKRNAMQKSLVVPKLNLEYADKVKDVSETERKRSVAYLKLIQSEMEKSS